ncbi:hypothetical protein GCM10025876_17900 [Demequina litorisediminis]|uniref:ABC transmembrane type-1 domain-containing protein n=1 Tax=Demequina litorisediminis TaxID=1849022 RepID=A0ABQ6IDV7_9MICO|nr:hypothetical protein GCM10025876_17900 [Demequina litorisediminis]
MLDRGLRGLAIYRSVYYLPSLLGGSVAIALLWRQVFGADGLVNAVLGWFGVEGQGWVSHPDYALGTLMILNIWTFGAPMIIFLAGLRQIPQMYYEAASIDGASKWRQFRSVTIPLLTPIIFFNLVLQAHQRVPDLHAGLRRQRRYRRPGGLDHVLHAVPLSKGLRVARHGIRLGDGVAPARDRGGHDGRQLPRLEVLGFLQ